jgi:hypothetical protein
VQSEETGICGVLPLREKNPPENPPPGMKTALARKNI